MYFPKFITKRIAVTFRELQIKEAMKLCEIPVNMNEYGVSTALKAIVEETSLPIEEWTVQERYAAICAYQTAKVQGDWPVSEEANYSDYPIEADYPETLYTFKSEANDGLILTVHPLTGAYAEAIENLVTAGVIDEEITPLSWIVGAMAAQIRGEEPDVVSSQSDIEALIKVRVEAIKALPESSFHDLLNDYVVGNQSINHIFNLWFDKDGIIFLAKEAGDKHPARFLFNAIADSRTIQLFERFNQPS